MSNCLLWKKPIWRVGIATGFLSEDFWKNKKAWCENLFQTFCHGRKAQVWLISLIIPTECPSYNSSKTAYKPNWQAAEQAEKWHFITLISWFGIIANNCLLILYIQQTQSNIIFYLELCFWPLDDCKFNIHSHFNSILLFINSCEKYLPL